MSVSESSPGSNLATSRDGQLSEDALLNWFSIKPRTFNWDALVLYDRYQANRLLLQEYIDRYAQGTYFKPVAGAINIVDGHWECLSNAVLDAPRLSFEISRVADSRAHLTMHLLSGLHFTVATSEAGTRRVSMINAYHPLQGPKLRLLVRLNESDGSVTKNGKVQINLASAETFKVIFGTTEDVQTRLGSFFKSEFNKWNDDAKILVLNEISRYEEGELFKPEEFRIRVTPAPGAAVRDSGHYGDGAVMVFVASQGSEVGQFPDEASDWMYPIPSGFSSTVIMSNKFMLGRLVVDGINKSPYIEGTAKFEYVTHDGGLRTMINLTSPNYFNYTGDRETDPEKRGHWVTCQLPLGPNGPDSRSGEFSVEVSGGTVVYSWKGGSTYKYVDVQVNHYVNEQRGPHVVTAGFFCVWRLSREFHAALADGKIVLRPRGGGDEELSLTKDFVDEGFDDPLDQAGGWAEVGLRNGLNKYFDGVINVTGEIDAFRLHGILFRSGDAMQATSVAVPRDVVLFGDISPSRTAFAIDPLESIVQAGKSLKLNVVPAQSGVSWKIETVAGYQGAPGSIAQDGTYTAPAAAALSGGNTAVRVTASVGGKSSSALVRVVAAAVHVNPLVAIAPAQGGVLKIAGGAVQGGALTWSIKSATGGTLTDVPPDGAAEFEPGDRFYRPGAGTSDQTYTVDEITATNASKDSSATSYIVVRNKIAIGNVVARKDPGLPANKVQLVMDNGAGDIPGVEWKVIAGGGQVDANGIFTADPASPHSFAIVTGFLSFPPFGEFNGVLILPIPLVDLDDLVGG